MYTLHSESRTIQKTHAMINNGGITTLSVTDCMDHVTDCMDHVRRTLGEKVWSPEMQLELHSQSRSFNSFLSYKIAKLTAKSSSNIGPDY